jgi:hypothetical protein
MEGTRKGAKTAFTPRLRNPGHSSRFYINRQKLNNPKFPDFKLSKKNQPKFFKRFQKK